MKIVISLGGTGGHIFPAQDLAKKLHSRGHKVYFFGKKGRFFSLKKFTFVEIATGNIRKKNPLSLLKAVFFLCKGIFQSIYLLWKIKPDIVVGFGSFHSFPVLCACILFKKKYVLFEPNIVCGLVNRIFSKKSLFIATQFPILEKHRAKKLHQTIFLPWDKSFRPINKNSHLTFIIFGGSQGAKFFNETIPLSIQRLQNIIVSFEIIHITGSKEITRSIQYMYDRLNVRSTVKEYEENILSKLCTCDFAICRSGAGTIGDLITTKTPAILVPYPFATDQHQEKNARYFVETIKGGIQISQENLNEKILFQKIEKMLQNDKQELKEYRQNLIAYYQWHEKYPTMADLIEA